MSWHVWKRTSPSTSRSGLPRLRTTVGLRGSAGITHVFLKGCWPSTGKERCNMRTTNNAKVVLALNHLIMTCKDGQKGFHKAGEGVKNCELKKLFNAYEDQRKRLGAELRPQILGQGGVPETGGTMAGAWRRRWMNLRRFVTEASDAVLVDEAERSDAIAVQSYEAALKENLPSTVRSLVERQYHEIKQVH